MRKLQGKQNNTNSDSAVAKWPVADSAVDLNFDPLEGIPELYATEHDRDPLVYACYRCPRSGWTWYVTEYDGSRHCFGLVAGFEIEFGYFDRLELETAGIKPERNWEAKPLSEVWRDLLEWRGAR
jgi:hypothetical protein